MTDARPQDLDPEVDPADDPGIEVVEPQPLLSDPEVPEADAWEQAVPADPDRPGAPSRRLSSEDAEVPEADAWEQAQPVDVGDEY